MSLDDRQHVEACAIIRSLVEGPPDPYAILTARNWLRENHPPPESYMAAVRSLVEEEA